MRPTFAWPYAALLVAGLCLSSCSCRPQSAPPAPGVTKGTGAYIGEKADLKPDADPGPKAKLVLAGTVIPVEVKVKPAGEDFAIDLWYNGELFEEEQYKDGATGFSLVNAAGETYSPPITLLMFPMNIGDSWKWSGQMLTGPAGRDATAVVRTLSDKVDTGTQEEALLVEVDLSMYSGNTSQPAQRRLSFWFVRNKGLLKREFGSSTSRVPFDAKTE